MKIKTIIILLLFLISCKKDNESLTSGNFIEINGDRRVIDATNPNVEIDCGTWRYPGWQFLIIDNQYSTGIAGLPNNKIEIFVNIWDTSLSKDNYSLVDYTGNKTDGFAEILIRPKKDGSSVIALESKTNSGSVRYKTLNGKRIVEFKNTTLYTPNSEYSFVVSGRIESD